MPPQEQGSYEPTSLSRYTSQSAEGVKTIKTSPGLVFGMLVTNVSVADIFLYVFDSASAGGARFMPPVKIPAAGGNMSVPLDQAIPFLTGLTIAPSSTVATYTPTGTSDLLMSVLYK